MPSGVAGAAVRAAFPEFARRVVDAGGENGWARLPCQMTR